MSGDSGLQEQPVVFYSEEMTEAKIILLSMKGIKFNSYNYYKVEDEEE